MNFSAYFIKNPIGAILLFTLLTMGGLFGFQKMQVQQLPDITFPAIVVTVALPGAAPSQLENDVAKKVENKLAGLDGIKHLSTTLQTGASTTVAMFELEKDSQEAMDEIRTAVSEVKSSLPAAANDPIISQISISDSASLIYTVESEKLNELDLSWFVSDTLDKRLSAIQEVGKISRIGGLNRIVKIEANPERMSALQMPIGSLSNQISYLQKDVSGGQAEVGKRIQTIRILGAVNSSNGLNDLNITVPNGGVESLSSIATVIDGAEEPSSMAKLDGKSVVAFSISRRSGASDVSMAKLVNAELAKLEKEMPHITVTKVFDLATPAENSYHASMKMLVEGGILAVIVVFLFLKNVRATIVTAVALPLSVIPSFLAMWLFDFSLNIISLLALSLVVGVLVDDAIVEVENIVRHLRMGKTPREAAMEAADEIGLAVIATTFTLIAVFLPTAFMGGVPGMFFMQFGWTASIAVFMSLLVARLITPMMAAYVMKPEKHITEEKNSKMMTKYLSVVGWTLNNRSITLFTVALLFIGSLSVFGLLPKAFIPANNSNQSRVSIELSPDATLEETLRISEMARMAIKNIDGVDTIMGSIGQPQSEKHSSGTGQAKNKASLDIVLVSPSERPNKSVIEKQITDALKSVPSARFAIGDEGGSGYSFKLTSSDSVLLEKTVTQVISEIRAIDTVSDVVSDRSLSTAEITVIPNRLAMADKGVTTQSIANTLRVATVGDYSQLLSKLNLDSRQIPIVVSMPAITRSDLDKLQDLYVPSAGRSPVQIGDVATLEFGNSPSQIRRYDRERAIEITVLSSGAALGDITAAVKKTATLSNMPSSISVSEQGDAETMIELFKGFLIAMAVGICCILGVLILLFNKILQPLTILMALPLSIGGAFMGLWITDSSLSMPSMIGLIMLMGIATKNSILLVDYAIVAERKGLSKEQAITDACNKRARPIIMTTIAMGAGMVPLLFSFGGVDNSFRQPMAAAVIGGLVTSTFLSLVVIPVVYSLMEDLSQFFKRLFRMRGDKSTAEVS